MLKMGYFSIQRLNIFLSSLKCCNGVSFSSSRLKSQVDIYSRHNNIYVSYARGLKPGELMAVIQINTYLQVENSQTKLYYEPNPKCFKSLKVLKVITYLSLKMENLNPKIRTKCNTRAITIGEEDDLVVDDFDSREVFDMIRDINDPEHPLTLEELNVVDLERVLVDNKTNEVKIDFTPTIPHCSMATLIGLSIRVQLIRSLPERFKVDVKITPGSHASESAINKQLADKERVAAALENSHLLEVVNNCLNIKDM